jgi:hypothetical protein
MHVDLHVQPVKACAKSAAWSTEPEPPLLPAPDAPPNNPPLAL